MSGWREAYAMYLGIRQVTTWCLTLWCVKRLWWELTLSSSFPLTSAKTNGASNWKQTWPCLTAWTEAGPQRYMPGTCNKEEGSISWFFPIDTALCVCVVGATGNSTPQLHQWLRLNVFAGYRRQMTNMLDQTSTARNASSIPNVKARQKILGQHYS